MGTPLESVFVAATSYWLGPGSRPLIRVRSDKASFHTGEGEGSDYEYCYFRVI